jgi:DNA-binding NarL/FixJ family response regulator
MKEHRAEPIRVVLADDHRIVRQGLCLILAQDPDITVVGEAADGHEAVELATKLKPHVVVMDIGMPGCNGLQATRLIRQQCPECQIMILSMYSDAPYVRETLRAGAKGYILKGCLDVDLPAAVRAVARGEAVLSPGVSNAVLDDYREHVRDPIDGVTPRELQLLTLLAEGKTSKDIAKELNISVYTVDAHRSRVMRKLKLRTIGEVVRFALQRGLISLREGFARPVLEDDTK